MLDDLGRCYCVCVRKMFEQRAKGEVMVSVAVCDENCSKGFVRHDGLDPRGEVVTLLSRKRRVNEDSVFLAVN
jgi:ribulose bisphosphate carboxylase small subunit